VSKRSSNAQVVQCPAWCSPPPTRVGSHAGDRQGPVIPILTARHPHITHLPVLTPNASGLPNAPILRPPWPLPQHYAPLQWGLASKPTLLSLEQLRHLVPPADTNILLDQPAPPTALELQDCRDFPATLQDFPLCLERAADLFDTVLLPSVHHHRTREAYYAVWQAFVSFAYIRNALITPESICLELNAAQLVQARDNHSAPMCHS
jgi:hypothetical protein